MHEKILNLSSQDKSNQNNNDKFLFKRLAKIMACQHLLLGRLGGKRRPRIPLMGIDTDTT